MLLKTSFVEEILKKSEVASPRILELGCGTARHIAPILQKHPEYTYVGIEPFRPSYTKAIEAIGKLPNVTLINEQAYNHIEAIDHGSFDIVFSLSVLEHVKHLPKFLSLSHMYARHGGLIVHRYDLGHALYPGSLKERFQVWVGNTFPYALPEGKFVRYVSEQEVKDALITLGCTIMNVTYHGMPNHRFFEKCAEANQSLTEAVQGLYQWEQMYNAHFSSIPQDKRERLFPAIAVWARKT